MGIMHEENPLGDSDKPRVSPRYPPGHDQFPKWSSTFYVHNFASDLCKPCSKYTGVAYHKLI